MSLDTYSNLKAAVENWSHRQDIGTHIDDFILLCETSFYNGVLDPQTSNTVSLRVKDQEELSVGACSTSDRFLALPTDYLEQRRLDLTVSAKRKPVTYQTPAQLDILTGTGIPSYFTVTDQVEFDILPDDTYVTNMQYYKKLTALDSTNTTNSILTNFPNIYLYGCLWALFQWARNTEEESKNLILFVNAIKAANQTSKRGQYGPNPRSRVRGSTP